MSRALRVADALIRSVEKFGRTVEPTSGWPSKFETCAVLRDEDVRFFTWELTSQSVKRVDGSTWSNDRYAYTPTGRLELRIDEFV